MRTALVLLFIAGVVNSAIIDSKTSPKTDNEWDDGDSMVLSTGTKDQSTTEQLVPEELTPPPFISLLPGVSKGKLEETTEDTALTDKTANVTNSEATTTESQEEQDDESRSTTEANSRENGDSTEDVKLAVVELSKDPLTFEIIPILVPDNMKVNLETTTEDDSASTTTVSSNNDKNEDNDESDLPTAPLTYMVPPRQEEENFWSRTYPPSTTEQVSTTKDVEELSQTPISATTTVPAETLLFDNPSIKGNPNQDEVSTNDVDSSTPGKDSYFPYEPTDGIDLTSMTPPPPPTGDEPAWNQPILPTPGQPEIIDYSPESQSIFPYRRDAVPLMDQYYTTDYLQRPGVMPMMNQIHPSLSMMSPPSFQPHPMLNPYNPSIMPKPHRPTFIHSDSYWPHKYFGMRDDVNANGGPPSPYMKFNGDYYRPQTNLILPQSHMANMPMQRPIGNTGMGYDDVTINNLPLSPPAPVSDRPVNNYIPSSPYQSPSPYVMNNRPLIPYQAYSNPNPSISMNDLMYAPSYPYNSYSRIIQMQPPPQPPQMAQIPMRFFV